MATAYDFVLVHDKVVRVDATAECGRTIEGVAWIIDPWHAHPCIRIDKPIGINAVTAIIGLIPRAVLNLTRETVKN